MRIFSKTKLFVAVLCASLALMLSFASFAEHPNLVITVKDVAEMRESIDGNGRFALAYQAQKARVDQQLTFPIAIPVPKDGGGGYTHEQHKRNYQLMYEAGVLYQLSREQRYAEHVIDMLLAYAELYPRLDVHPKRKVKSQNPGKLFWQSLNEAMWLVYTIQAYDLIHDALGASQKTTIEQQLLRPVALFLSEGQPSTFNKVHNHGTWATAAVGMAGYVLGEPEWVEKALYDLEKTGQGGFLKQLDELFSPQGYYNEGPYYQRFALLPFVTFARAIENNEAKRNIFAYRNNVLLKAIDTTVQLSYNGLFYPINDAIKSKGIDTIELVHGVAAAYSLTGETGYLDIAEQQGQIVLTGDGLKVAQALDAGAATAYQFRSVAFGDGANGTQGALVIMRGDMSGEQSVLFKPAAQGLGHGHFDKLTWQFYDRGTEIVSDYGAARFLNVEAKFGGRYLPENQTYAKQTVSHNTVVVDETSHFNGKVRVGNANWPTLNFFATSEQGSVAQAEIASAYDDVLLTRTIALIELAELEQALVLDVFDVIGENAHQLDLPLHYQGQLIDTNFNYQGNLNELRALGDKNGYQHLWLRAKAQPEAGMAKVTWLNENGHFYTQTSLVQGDEQFLFTQLGANDPNFNLRNEHGFIRRAQGATQHRFVSLLEPHGEYNPSKEYTLDAVSQVSDFQLEQTGDIIVAEVVITGKRYLLAIDTRTKERAHPHPLSYKNHTYTLSDRLTVLPLKSDLEN